MLCPLNFSCAPLKPFPLPAAVVVPTELCSGFVMAKLTRMVLSLWYFDHAWWCFDHRCCGGVAVCSISRKLHGMTKLLPLECLYVMKKKVVMVLSSLHSRVTRSLPKSLACPCIGHK